ncbi:MAG: acylphosphatase [Nevskiaceae bacterium]|nr:MAG: acylphosphatase [Nevskiaceae bacterium]TAM30482.1 MAG: acylphosphatase [Nevskiaceae bacterium]
MTGVYRFRVRGRVQGVGFRQATQRRASQLGLEGWVRNCADGSVEGLATGSPTALERLRQWLQQGPPTAWVESLDWQADAETVEAGRGYVVLR